MPVTMWSSGGARSLPILIRFGENLKGSSKVEYSSVSPSKLALSSFFFLDFLATFDERDSRNKRKYVKQFCFIFPPNWYKTITFKG